MSQKEPVFAYLERITQFIPAPFYWFDKNGVIVGYNKLAADHVEASKQSDGGLQKCVQAVLLEQAPSVEHYAIANALTGEIKRFAVGLIPLKNIDAEIIGVAAISFDDLDQKAVDNFNAAMDQLEYALNNEHEASIIRDGLPLEPENFLVKIAHSIKSDAIN